MGTPDFFAEKGGAIMLRETSYRQACLGAMQVDIWQLRSVAARQSVPARPVSGHPLLPAALRQPYLAVMQVDLWRSRAAVMPDVLETVRTIEPSGSVPDAPAPAPRAGPVCRVTPVADTFSQMPANVHLHPPVPLPEPPVPAVPEATPRFTLQLYEVEGCQLLVSLPRGDPLAPDDPARVLLADLLMAAGFSGMSPLQPGSPPVRWPLLRSGGLDQGAQGARDYVQEVARQARLRQPAAALWLVGAEAWDFAGGLSREVAPGWQSSALGPVLLVPDLEVLINSTSLKARFWSVIQQGFAGTVTL